METEEEQWPSLLPVSVYQVSDLDQKFCPIDNAETHTHTYRERERVVGGVGGTGTGTVTGQTREEVFGSYHFYSSRLHAIMWSLERSEEREERGEGRFVFSPGRARCDRQS